MPYKSTGSKEEKKHQRERKGNGRKNELEMKGKNIKKGCGGYLKYRKQKRRKDMKDRMQG